MDIAGRMFFWIGWTRGSDELAGRKYLPVGWTSGSDGLVDQMFLRVGWTRGSDGLAVPMYLRVGWTSGGSDVFAGQMDLWVEWTCGSDGLADRMDSFVWLMVERICAVECDVMWCIVTYKLSPARPSRKGHAFELTISLVYARWFHWMCGQLRWIHQSNNLHALCITIIYNLHVQLLWYRCAASKGWRLEWALCSWSSLMQYWHPFGGISCLAMHYNALTKVEPCMFPYFSSWPCIADLFGQGGITQGPLLYKYATA